MCGVVGIVAFSGKTQVSSVDIRKMGETIRHRGPDDEGYFVEPNVALGNLRLSIIDLQSGKQPIFTPDNRFTIVYNGEIFNYRELRKESECDGLKFSTSSDTEVVLAGFVKHGLSFLDRLDGMFAFLIYDSQDKIVYAGRDPFGIKPLYGYVDSDRLYLASEIKAIQAVCKNKPTLNLESLSSYLQCGYVVGRETLYKGVFRVAPGSVLKISANGEMKEEYFAKRLLPESLAGGGNTGKSIEDTLIQAVESSLVSDVPVGLYLSGGIDSSLIASIVSRELGEKLRSFSVCFPEDKSYDEGPYAQMVARELGLEHESIEAHMDDFKDLNLLARQLEEPMADPSAVPLGRLSSLASKELKVVLSGEGGDEFFGGYHRYFWDRFVRRYRSMPRTLRAITESLGGVLASGRRKRRLTKLRDSIELERSARFLSWFSPFTKNEKESLLVEQMAGPRACEKIFAEAFESAKPLPETAQAQWVDVTTFLRDDLLFKADKMSMINSLEVRVPFLQADVAQAAFGLKERDRVRMRETKPFLRKMLRKYLPTEIAERKKQGFEVPLGRWFRGPLRSVLDRYLSENVVKNRGVLRWDAVEKIRQEHEVGQADRGLALFSLALFEAWAQEHLDS